MKKDHPDPVIYPGGHQWFRLESRHIFYIPAFVLQLAVSFTQRQHIDGIRSIQFIME
jgi:hypothetical protein